MTSDDTPEIAELRAVRRRYDRTAKAHEESDSVIKAAIVSALKAGARVTDVEELSPFTPRYTRTIAREAGVEPRRRP